MSGYTITTGNGSGLFSINSSTGALSATGTLDFETTSTYTLGITVSDGTYTSSAGSVTININNLNDNAPVVTTATFSIPENATVGSTVGTAAATDPDTGSPTLSNWTIISGNTGGAFSINPSTGVITTNTTLDEETTNSYSLGVTVYDGANTSTSQVITINVTDVNEHAPVIASGQIFSIAENATTGTNLSGTSPTATDADGTSSFSSWVIVSGNTGIAFSINSSTGILSTSASLDREAIASYSLGITVSDGTNTSASETITINLTDINDNAPIVTSGQTFSINEGNLSSVSVGSVNANDIDLSTTLSSFTITSGNTSGFFTIDGTTGALTATGNIDYENTTSFTLGITVSDGTNTSAVENVAINVINLNDSPPVITASQSFSLNENQSAGFTIGTVTATDPDTGTPTLDNWSIVSGNTGGAFSINPATGALTTNIALDRETLANYTLGIQVNDGTNTSSTETISLTINDLNDSPPIITPGQTLSVAEDVTTGFSITGSPITVTDADASATYSGWAIVSGNTGGAFSINASTGVISTSATLDRETLANYTLGLQVSDGTNTSVTEILIINLSNVNDTPPIITSGQVFTLPENASSGTNLFGTPATVTDADGTTTYSGWTIVSGNTGSAFSIDASTGVISSSATLDRETIASYTLGLEVSDGTNTSSAETVTINLSDINDTAPVVTAGQTLSVDEGALSSTPVGTVTATDADIGGAFSGWTISSGNSSGFFAINNSTGAITATGNIDYETTTSYTLGITVSDGTNTSTAGNVIININNLNDNPPSVTAATLSIAENASIGSSVGTISATDPDTSTPTLSNWNIVSGNTGGAFSINPSTGVVTTNITLDEETTNTYTLGITVNDGVNSSSIQNITVNVTDINEHAPVIASGQSYSISESAASGTSLSGISPTVTDADGTSTFSSWAIVSGNTGGAFSINSTTGVISTSTSLDRETTANYSLGITVSDGTLTSTQETIAVNLSDINDNSPVITVGQNLLLNEGTHTTASVGTVNTTDPDLSTTFSSFTISSGNGSGFFSINSSTGAITATGSIDYETTSSYSLGITVSDGTNTSSVGTVMVTIINLNDSPPVVAAAQSFSLNENQSSGTTVGTVLATDPDNPSPTLSNWGIVSGNTGGAFNINPSTGEITTNISLDRENIASYTLGVRVTDGINTSVTETVTISVNDLNDSPPIILAGQTLTVVENATTGTVLSGTPITVTDTDGTTTYSSWAIVSGNTGTAFSIDASTGAISTNTTLDRETLASYTLGLQVSDGTNTSSTETVIINVGDINDNAPNVVSGQAFNVSENAVLNSLVGLVQATDVDAGVTTFNNWTIASGNTGNAFSINSTTGQLTVNGVLDRETLPSYTVGITVSDGTNTSASQTITISVGDINDEAPVITSGQSFTLTENSITGTSVGIILATDLDLSTTYSNWTITAGNIGNAFSLNSTTGELTVNNSPDREITSSYSLTVEVSDGVNTSGSQTVTVTISDQNDNAPVITTGQSFAIAEGSATGTTLGTVAATDSDNGTSYSNWSITSGNIGNAFNINSSTGVIQVNGTLDRETLPSYTLTLLVSDGTNISSAESIIISLTDLNDATPSVNSGQSFTIAENSPTGTSIGTIIASDADLGTTFSAWAITSGNTAGVFTLDANTGELSVNGSLDRESTAAYTLGITVSDGTNTSAVENINISITDLNDLAPIITSGQNFTISENLPTGSSAGTILATDGDQSTTFSNWTITSGNTGSPFSINSTTGQITTNVPLDRETLASYTLGITVSDGSATSSVESITINVGDLNDNNPVINAGQSFSVNESAPNGASIGTVTASDADLSTSFFSWSITSGNTGNAFSINANTGEITLLNTVDRETIASYTLGITVSDGVNTSSVGTITINVLDFNDIPPVITTGQSFNVAEGSVLATSVGTLIATDVDLGTTFSNWTIVSGNLGSVFNIDGTTGELSVNGILDREVNGSYTLSITVSDGNSSSSPTDVVITITDINDNAPTVNAGQVFNIAENSSLSTSIGIIQASDADLSTVLSNWTISSGNTGNVFAINSSTGQLSVNGNLDREITANYNLGNNSK